MHAPLKSLETSPTTVGSDVSARNAPVGAVRAFLTLLVIAHHAVLTYHPYAPPPKGFTEPPILWTAFPVVDPQRFAGFGLLPARLASKAAERALFPTSSSPAAADHEPART